MRKKDREHVAVELVQCESEKAEHIWREREEEGRGNSVDADKKLVQFLEESLGAGSCGSSSRLWWALPWMKVFRRAIRKTSVSILVGRWGSVIYLTLGTKRGDDNQYEDGTKSGVVIEGNSAVRDWWKWQGSRYSLLYRSICGGHFGAMSWRLKRCVEITPQIGMTLVFQWQCEWLRRAQTTAVGVQVRLISRRGGRRSIWTAASRNVLLSLHLAGNLEVGGLWKLNEFTEHDNKWNELTVGGGEVEKPRWFLLFCLYASPGGSALFLGK